MEDKEFQKKMIEYKLELLELQKLQTQGFEKRVNELISQREEIINLNRRISELEEKINQTNENLDKEKQKNRLEAIFKKFNKCFLERKVKRMESVIFKLTNSNEKSNKEIFKLDELRQSDEDKNSEPLNYNLLAIEFLLMDGIINK